LGLIDGPTRKPHLQRCAVRVTYSPNRVRGQWAAHGRYIARESAAGRGKDGKVGFSAAADGIDIAKTLGAWQAAADLRLFKLIISPEFGERLDLRQHTRELVARMEKDLGIDLEWVAVAHSNTGHPHVHIALRGRTQAGPLRLDRDYIKRGIREHAETLATAQLGFRTELDALEAERREVDAPRITSLDRRIARQAFGAEGDGTFALNFLRAPISVTQRARQHFLTARLRTLRVMGLSEELKPDHWRISPAFLSVLHTMQISQDRLKTLAGAASDRHQVPEGRRDQSKAKQPTSNPISRWNR
jgi:type IV secretory pathway VirD2 relaxase